MMMLSNEDIHDLMYGRGLPMDTEDAIEFARAIERAVLAKASQQAAGFDECCATGQSCEYEVCTLNGEQQCKYCGKEPSDMAPIQTAPAPKQEPVAVVERNLAGQITLKAGDGGYFDISKYVGARFYMSPPQAAAIPEAHNIREVKRGSDQSVTVVFASCRAASAFEKALSAPKPEDKP